MAEQFDDPYEVRIGIPTASWKYARPKDGFRGVILPQKNEDGAEAAYRLSQQVNMQGELLWWNRPDGSKKARVQQDFLLGNLSDLRSGRPLTAEDFISSKATERFEKARETNETAALELIDRVSKFALRRQIVKGESLEKGFRSAAASITAATGTNRPVVATIVTVLLEKLEPNDHGGETKIFAVKFEAPTEESRAFVERFRASVPDASDPYSGGDSPAGGSLTSEPGSGESGDDEEPPF
jgi:hypothetical protein